MKQSVKNRLGAAAADLALLCTGPVAAIISGAVGADPSTSFLDSMDVLCIIVMCFFTAIVTVEIISVFKISDSTAHTVFIAASLLGYCLSSPDFIHFLGAKGAVVSVYAAECFNFAFFICVILSVIYFWNYTFQMHIPKQLQVFAIAAGVACAAAYAGLYLLGLQAAALGAFTAFTAAALAYVYHFVYGGQNADLSFYSTEALLYLMFGSATVNVLCGSGIIKFPSAGFTSFYSLGAVLLFALVYVAYAMRTDRAALKASEYKLKYERVRTEALRGQIKPHFIFNSLAAIQSLYHKSLEEGDRATSLFSRHLRANVEAANTDLIPFERELDNIQVYVDLENMRYEKKFNVIFDIDYTDFYIPVLSLQPYIENAMRYSKVNENPDGYIKISTAAAEGGVTLEVSDNGAGFDVNAVPQTSCGINNSRERFKVLMGVEPQIISAPGKGAVVTVFIPGNGRSKNENNYS